MHYKSLTYTRWDCKYHIIFIPKCRQKVIYGQLRKELGRVFHELARRKKVEIVEGHLMVDHVRMCISIPPKEAVSNILGYIKGKSAITIAREFRGKQRNFSGAGAGDGFDGASAVHTHMTNSHLTDPEVLVWRFPVLLESFQTYPRLLRIF